MDTKIKKTCLYCGNEFSVFPEEDWKFLCVKCYAKYYIPAKDKYSLANMKTRRDEIKKEVDSMENV